MQRKDTPYSKIEYETKVARAPQWDAGAPRINGASIYGATPEREFLYLVPTLGERPMRFSAHGLPMGLAIDADRGIIAGKVTQKGRHTVILTAENRLGKATRTLEIVISDRSLALTPPMGWNSWNCFRSDISQAQISEVADAMVSSGLAAHGYGFVNIDSGWQSQRRGGQFNAIVPADAFPDMQELCRHIHSLGLKAGIYSSPYVHPWGTTGLGSTDGLPDTSFPGSFTTYGKYIGLTRHEPEDALQWADWGFDYLKYDWVVTDMDNAAEMRKALDAVDRDMVFSLVIQVALADAQRVGELANLFRANADTAPTWDSIRKNGFRNNEWNPFIAPGHWLDLDMTATTPRDGNSLTHDELLAHISCWMMRPSPIMLDCDPRHLDPYLADLLCNDEIIAVNQDALGKPAASILSNDAWDIQIKPLADGGCALAFFNLGNKPAIAPEQDLGYWLGGQFQVRDLWAHEDLGDLEDGYVVGVAPHSAKAYRLIPKN